MWRVIYILIWAGLGAIALFGCSTPPKQTVQGVKYVVRIND